MAERHRLHWRDPHVHEEHGQCVHADARHKDGGYIYKPGNVQDPQHLEAFERGMRDTLQFINDCLKLGLLQLAPAKGRKA